LRYIELKRQKQAVQTLMDVFGSDEFVTPFKKIIATSRSKLTEAVLQRGSGFVKLVEELIYALDAGLKEAEATSDDELLKAKLIKLFDKVVQRMLTTFHNVLINDPNMIVHETIHWLFELYRNAKNVELPTLDLVNSLSEEDRALLMQDAERAQIRELENLRRPAGSSKIPPPKLVYGSKLIEQYKSIMYDQLNRFETKRLPNSSLYFTNAVAIRHSSARPALLFVDITWTESQAKEFRGRGYNFCGSTSSMSLWSRSFNPSPYQELPPIVDIKLSERAENTPPGWTLIPRNFNKGAFSTGKMFVLYRRAAPNETSTAPVLGVRLVPALDKANMRLGANSWKCIGVFRSSMFMETKVWILNTQ